MKQFNAPSVAAAIVLATNLLTSCGGRAKMQQCKFVEIEAGEFEVELGDVDVESGEVEMVCGDSIVDVPWNQFKRELRIDPERYANNLEAFKREVTCLINENSNDKIVFCSRSQLNDEFVGLRFNYDD